MPDKILTLNIWQKSKATLTFLQSQITKLLIIIKAYTYRRDPSLNFFLQALHSTIAGICGALYWAVFRPQATFYIVVFPAIAAIIIHSTGCLEKRASTLAKITILTATGIMCIQMLSPISLLQVIFIALFSFFCLTLKQFRIQGAMCIIFSLLVIDQPAEFMGTINNCISLILGSIIGFTACEGAKFLYAKPLTSLLCKRIAHEITYQLKYMCQDNCQQETVRLNKKRGIKLVVGANSFIIHHEFIGKRLRKLSTRTIILIEIFKDLSLIIHGIDGKNFSRNVSQNAALKDLTLSISQSIENTIVNNTNNRMIENITGWKDKLRSMIADTQDTGQQQTALELLLCCKTLERIRGYAVK